jgi:ubiquitin C-terminal hydrolase
LVAVILHHGNTLTTGHYTAIGLRPDGHYYRYSDSTVSGPITDAEWDTSTRDASIVLYEKIQNVHENVEENVNEMVSLLMLKY